MFADSLFDSAASHRLRCGWPTFFSFALQSLSVGLLLLLPLFYTQALPQLTLLEQLVAPTPPSGPPPIARAPSRNTAPSNMLGSSLLTPSRIPNVIANINEGDVPPPPDVGSGPWVEGGTGARDGRSPMALFGNGVSPLPPPPTAATATAPRVSRMMEGNLIHQVQPPYPPLARQARIQGTVLLRALISREGRIENLQVVSGHPMLVSAAMEAVRQWRYRPYLLNDQAVEVETTITVNFMLTGG